MKKLYEYEVLVKDTFYRGWHVLEYLENHFELLEVDKEAISATIMDALVYKKQISKEEDALDLEHLQIVKSQDPKYYHWQEHPWVMGFPMKLKEQMRSVSCSISSHLPLSLFLTLPYKNRCVYDMNLAISKLFPTWKHYDGTYSSLTRNNIQATRPFMEVEIDGVKYFVDCLTRRIFESSEFQKRTQFKAKNEVEKESLIEEAAQFYQNAIADSLDLTAYASFILPYLEQTPRNAEHFYEIVQSKKRFPEEWQKVAQSQAEYQEYILDLKLKKNQTT